jgi:hypothetical protein
LLVPLRLLLGVLSRSRRRELSARACDQVIGPLALAKRARPVTEPEVDVVAVVVESDHALPAVDVQDGVADLNEACRDLLGGVHRY